MDWNAAFKKAEVEPAVGCEESDPFFITNSRKSDNSGSTMELHDVVSSVLHEKSPVSESSVDADETKKRKISNYDSEGSDKKIRRGVSSQQPDPEACMEGVLLPSGQFGLVESSARFHNSSVFVYSGTERQENGSFIVIGTLYSSSGDIQLFNEPSNNTEMLDFPYPTDSNDHCETPEQAYIDVVSILKRISKKIAKVKKSKHLKIYDPYYCNGGVIDKLSLLGYPKVHNEKVDCYSVWESGNLPDFDVLVTNPPYSGDHIEKLIKFLSSKKFGNKPWMLLCPEFVHKKDYYTELMKKKKRPLYIVPNKRYIYLPPRGFREKKASATHKKSSPFTSYWYIWGGSNEMTDMLAEFFQQHGGNDCKTARSKNELRELRRKNRKKQKI